MTETKLRTLVSVFLMLSQIVLLLMLLVLLLNLKLTGPEFSTSMGIMVPALSGFATMAVAYAISMKGKKQYAARSQRLSGIYVFTTLLFPSLFVVALVGLVLLKGFGQSTFEQFKLSLATVETIFAGYSGKLMASLFGSQVPA